MKGTVFNMWIIISIILGAIAAISLIYNAVKDTKIDALEYEVAYLLDIIFNNDGDVVFRSDEIKDEWDKRIK